MRSIAFADFLIGVGILFVLEGLMLAATPAWMRPALSRRLRLMGGAILLGAASLLSAAPAFARGPDGIADVAEKVIDAVVNISTSQTVEAKGGGNERGAMPQLPPGSPFEEFFDDFFKNRKGPGAGSHHGAVQPHNTNRLGSRCTV